MPVQNKVLYAFRGWIAFVAFMDLGTASRSYIEKRSFFGNHAENEFIDSDHTVSRMLGMYCILKALALMHCTLYIHYRPVVSMGYWSLVLTIILYLTEALYFHSTTINFYIVFPFTLNTITLIGLAYLPTKLKLWGQVPGTSGMEREIEDENVALLRQMGNFKKRRAGNTKNKNV